MRSLVAFLLTVLVCGACLAADMSSLPKVVRITAYNNDFALVKELRDMTLSKGVNSVDVENVAAKIDPTSVLFKSLTNPRGVMVLEQNYQFDLIDPANILNKSVGKKVTYTRFADDGRPIVESGTLLNPAGNAGAVMRTKDGSLTLNPWGQVTLDKLPDGLHPRPTLNWLLKAAQAGANKVEVTYITGGINWQADYVALVNKDDTALDLTGWVSLTNNSGATYKDAKLTLMAGDVRRVRGLDEPEVGLGTRTLSLKRSAAKPQFEEKSFFEYHMYTMGRPTSVRDKETKQLSLLGAASVPVKKEMIYDARGDWFRSWWSPGRNGDPGSGYDTSNYHKVSVTLEVKNSKENNMGMPLPKGRVRVYKLDDTGSQQFIGEDQIDHTPKDEKVRLYVGDAFDVVGDYKRTNYKKISSNVVEESFEVKIRNHKKTAVTVKVVEHVWSDWSMVKKTHEFTKKDAHTIEFPVTVKPDKESVIKYTVRTKW